MAPVPAVPPAKKGETSYSQEMPLLAFAIAQASKLDLKGDLLQSLGKEVGSFLKKWERHQDIGKFIEKLRQSHLPESMEGKTDDELLRIAILSEAIMDQMGNVERLTGRNGCARADIYIELAFAGADAVASIRDYKLSAPLFSSNPNRWLSTLLSNDHFQECPYNKGKKKRFLSAKERARLEAIVAKQLPETIPADPEQKKALASIALAYGSSGALRHEFPQAALKGHLMAAKIYAKRLPASVSLGEGYRCDNASLNCALHGLWELFIAQRRRPKSFEYWPSGFQPANKQRERFLRIYRARVASIRARSDILARGTKRWVSKLLGVRITPRGKGFRATRSPKSHPSPLVLWYKLGELYELHRGTAPLCGVHIPPEKEPPAQQPEGPRQADIIW